MSIENNNGDFFVEIVRKLFVIGYPLGAHDFALVLGVVSKMLFFKISKFKYCKQGFFSPRNISLRLEFTKTRIGSV